MSSSRSASANDYDAGAGGDQKKKREQLKFHFPGPIILMGTHSHNLAHSIQLMWARAHPRHARRINVVTDTPEVLEHILTRSDLDMSWNPRLIVILHAENLDPLDCKLLTSYMNNSVEDQTTYIVCWQRAHDYRRRRLLEEEVTDAVIVTDDDSDSSGGEDASDDDADEAPYFYINHDDRQYVFVDTDNGNDEIVISFDIMGTVIAVVISVVLAIAAAVGGIPSAIVEPAATIAAATDHFPRPFTRGSVYKQRCWCPHTHDLKRSEFYYEFDQSRPLIRGPLDYGKADFRHPSADHELPIFRTTTLSAHLNWRRALYVGRFVAALQHIPTLGSPLIMRWMADYIGFETDTFVQDYCSAFCRNSRPAIL